MYVYMYALPQKKKKHNQQLIGDYTTHSRNISGLHRFLIFLNTHNIL